MGFEGTKIEEILKHSLVERRENLIKKTIVSYISNGKNKKDKYSIYKK